MNYVKLGEDKRSIKDSLLKALKETFKIFLDKITYGEVINFYKANLSCGCLSGSVGQGWVGCILCVSIDLVGCALILSQGFPHGTNLGHLVLLWYLLNIGALHHLLDVNVVGRGLAWLLGDIGGNCGLTLGSLLVGLGLIGVVDVIGRHGVHHHGLEVIDDILINAVSGRNVACDFLDNLLLVNCWHGCVYKCSDNKSLKFDAQGVFLSNFLKSLFLYESLKKILLFLMFLFSWIRHGLFLGNPKLQIRPCMLRFPPPRRKACK